MKRINFYFCIFVLSVFVFACTNFNQSENSINIGIDDQTNPILKINNSIDSILADYDGKLERYVGSYNDTEFGIIGAPFRVYRSSRVGNELTYLSETYSYYFENDGKFFVNCMFTSHYNYGSESYTVRDDTGTYFVSKKGDDLFITINSERINNTFKYFVSPNYLVLLSPEETLKYESDSLNYKLTTKDENISSNENILKRETIKYQDGIVGLWSIQKDSISYKVNPYDKYYTTAYKFWYELEFYNNETFSFRQKSYGRYSETINGAYKLEQEGDLTYLYILTEDNEFYKFDFDVSTNYLLLPNFTEIFKICTLTYSTQFGDRPSSKAIKKGTVLTENELPTLTYSYNGYKKTFLYWEYENEEIIPDKYIINYDVELVAKWKD